MSADPTLVLVHGAWHGSWSWEALLPGLAGVNVRTVGLPSLAAPSAGLYADAEVLRAAVAAVPGPVVVCAHSYGGAVLRRRWPGCRTSRMSCTCVRSPSAGASQCSARASHAFGRRIAPPRSRSERWPPRIAGAELTIAAVILWPR